MKHFLMACMIFLAGCAGTPSIRTIEAPRVPVSIPDPDPMVLDDVQWHVATISRLQTLLAKMAHDPSYPATLMLDHDDFIAEQNNEIETARTIVQQRAIISTFRSLLSSDQIHKAP